jgi:enoyl-CoA hydratase
MADIPDEEPEPVVIGGKDDVWAGVLAWTRGQDAWLKYGMKKFLLYECDYENKIVYITWNRPEKLNAGCPYPAAEACLAARDDPDCKAIVMRANGRGFGAGYDITPDIGYGEEGRRIGRDLSEPIDAGETFSQRPREKYKSDFFRQRLWDNHKPIICLIHGYCIAGANDCTTKADLIYSTPDALFGYNILRGSPLPAMHTFNPWFFTIKKAKEICYTGNLIPASELYNVGYINKILSRDDIENYVDMIAKEIAALPSITISLTKRGIHHYYDSMGKRESEDFAEAMRAMAIAWVGGGPDDYGSKEWRKATTAKGLSYHLRERGKPFREADALWRERVAARPKFETGTKEKGWDQRPEVIAARKKAEKILEQMEK